MNKCRFYNQSVLIIFVMISIVSWSTYSCTEVDIRSSEIHQPTRSFQIQWPNSEVLEQPDTLLFIANRMINTWRTACLVSTKKNEIQVLFPELPAYYSQTREESKSSNDEITLDRLPLRSGPTHFFAVNWNEKYAIIRNFHKLQNVEEVPVNILEQAYVCFPLTDKRVLSDDKSWISYNRTEDKKVYLAADLPALWMAESNRITIHQDDNQSLDPIVLRAKRLSQQLDIQFSINCGKGVNIDEIRGEISGIPRSIRINNGIFSSRNTLRLLFNAEFLSQKLNTVEGKSYSLETYHKKINVITVIPNNSPTAASGDGILQLNITGSYINTKGKKVAMNHMVLINMYHALRDLDLIKVASLDTPLFQANKQQAIVVVNDVLTVDEEGIKVRGQQVQSMDYWTVCDDEISVEV